MSYFNLNDYLRTFVRNDFIDEYEKRCLDVVEKYKDQKTQFVFLNMIEDFNSELMIMAKAALNETKIE